jgi:hypothetical protein
MNTKRDFMCECLPFLICEDCGATVWKNELEALESLRAIMAEEAEFMAALRAQYGENID